MKAVIMAGGEGTRLRPLTSNAPKPMLPIANRPMMEHIIGLLKRHGFDEIVVTVAFLANAHQDLLRRRQRVRRVDALRRRARPARHRRQRRQRPRAASTRRFLVISGDVITDIDLTTICDFHDERGAMATIGLTAVDNPLEFGIVITRDDGSIERFLEKPTWGQVFSDTINTGIYVLEPEIFDYIPEGRSVDFSSEVFPALLADGEPLYGAVAEGYWEDVGTLEAYLARAQGRARPARSALDIPGFRVNDGVWMGEGAEISPDAVVDRPGGHRSGRARSRRAASSASTPCSAATSACSARRTSSAASLHDNVYVGPAHAHARRRHRAQPAASAATCASTRAWCSATRCSSAPTRSSAATSRSTRSRRSRTARSSTRRIVWESKGARSLFGRDGVTGLANVDVTAGAGREGRHGLRHHRCARAPRSSRRATPAARRGC